MSIAHTLRRVLPGVVHERGAPAAPLAPALAQAAAAEPDALLASLGSRTSGLSSAEAAARLAATGPNTLAHEAARGGLQRLGAALRDPLVVLLAVLATLSFVSGDARAGTVMLVMIALGVTLRLVQETRAESAAAKLRSLLPVTANVRRDGAVCEVDLATLVPGDIVELAAGDRIPADVRVLIEKDLFVAQATLTGESLPVEKVATPEPHADRPALECRSVCFFGTSVESGTATAVVVATGARTLLGGLAHALAEPAPETAFERGVRRFTWLMIRFMIVLVPLVFLVNGLTKHEWRDAFFFTLAVAVGLTPEMLPMIVSVCLSNGAVAMARRKVIVKRLDAIQNFGAMDVLCTDKTGTLTMDRVALKVHWDLERQESAEVLQEAYLISHFQTGLRNVLDRAVLEHQDVHVLLETDRHTKLDEMPFDFSRRMMSVALADPAGACRLFAKGAPESVLSRCTQCRIGGEVMPLTPERAAAFTQLVEDLGADGFRVLAVATRALERRASYSRVDECELVLTGALAFLDPPKESAGEAVAALRASGVRVKVLTGDGERVARKVCGDVGLACERVLLGADVAALDDVALADAVAGVDVFARLAPADKRRIVLALQRRGHVVGFMGDGINDAPALRAADVGLSVDNAVDAAKDSADLILLEKSLMVLLEGVREGRKVFVNILKYVRMGASSNFGNMFSVLGASAWLPFVPMAPLQVLTNNLLYDLSQVPIPTDAVSEAQIARPRPWDMGSITKFIVAIGPVSSLFDYATFAILWWVFRCRELALAPPAALAARFAEVHGANASYAAALFHTGWFVESLVTQTLIVHVIRTDELPFVRSRASAALTLTTLAVVLFGAWLPYSPIAAALGFVPLPARFWPMLAGLALGYVALTQGVKRTLVRSGIF